MVKTRASSKVKPEKDMYLGKAVCAGYKEACNLAFVTTAALYWVLGAKLFVLDGVELRTTRMLEKVLGLDGNKDVIATQCFPESFRKMRKAGKTRNLHYGTVRRWITTRGRKVSAAFLDYCGTLTGRSKPFPSDPDERPNILDDVALFFERRRLTDHGAFGLTFCGRSKKLGGGDEQVAIEHVKACAAKAGQAVELTSRLRRKAMIFLLFRVRPINETVH